MIHQFARLRRGERDHPLRHHYVERGGELVTRHPFDLYTARLYIFPVSADQERLRLLCDYTFRTPTAGAEWYVPIAGVVLVSFADINVVRSSNLPDRALGMCTERETCIWLPIFDRRRNRIVWTMPYLFVDEVAPLVGGRETFGYPKQLGTMVFQKDSHGPSLFELRARCIHRFAPESRVAEHCILRIHRSDISTPISQSTPTCDHPALVIDEIVRRQRLRTPTNRDHLASEDMLRHDSVFMEDQQVRVSALFLNDVAGGVVSVVLLKQFRDTAYTRQACYQAVTEVSHQVVSFRRGAPLYREWKVEVADLDGEPLIRELGLPPATVAGPSFWVDFDFQIHSGRPLWEARP
jgi:hypothetical protein